MTIVGFLSQKLLLTTIFLISCFHIIVYISINYKANISYKIYLLEINKNY